MVRRGDDKRRDSKDHKGRGSLRGSHLEGLLLEFDTTGKERATEDEEEVGED